mmetsp:Transcript_15440/g.35092  ORF Transcript_15440/g.35092 Transcript_15440/m.35092 type:complete len:288 (-) Transcript_15440:1243-2106(-)
MKIRQRRSSSQQSYQMILAATTGRIWIISTKTKISMLENCLLRSPDIQKTTGTHAGRSLPIQQYFMSAVVLIWKTASKSLRVHHPSNAAESIFGLQISRNATSHVTQVYSAVSSMRRTHSWLIFLLPFGNFVSYFSVPPISEFPNKEVSNVWNNFVDGDQQYRDARLKLLPVVLEGPWIVKAAVGNGKSPALLGKVIPIQYFFRQPNGAERGVYEVDVIITASTIAKGILNVVKGHAKNLSIGFALIIEASKQEELPETVLCSFQIHSLNLDDCPRLPEKNLDVIDQ